MIERGIRQWLDIFYACADAACVEGNADETVKILKMANRLETHAGGGNVEHESPAACGEEGCMVCGDRWSSNYQQEEGENK